MVVLIPSPFTRGGFSQIGTGSRDLSGIAAFDTDSMLLWVVTRLETWSINANLGGGR
jgi:hypothetical protein